jgi:hypothetical protein
LTAPTWGSDAPGLPGYLFVTDQPGTVWAIDLATGAKSVFLDASGLLSGLLPNGGLGARTFLPFDARGLLGVAFHPDFAANGLFYTYTTEAADGQPADFSLAADLTPAEEAQFSALGLLYPNHQTVIREWMANDPADPTAGVGAISRVLMRTDQPQFNHDAGALAFDHDRMLLIALGDGGGADDSPEPHMQDFIGVPILGHGEVGNGQNPGTVPGRSRCPSQIPRGSTCWNGPARRGARARRTGRPETRSCSKRCPRPWRTLATRRTRTAQAERRGRAFGEARGFVIAEPTG